MLPPQRAVRHSLCTRSASHYLRLVLLLLLLLVLVLVPRHVSLAAAGPRTNTGDSTQTERRFNVTLLLREQTAAPLPGRDTT